MHDGLDVRARHSNQRKFCSTGLGDLEGFLLAEIMFERNAPGWTTSLTPELASNLAVSCRRRPVDSMTGGSLKVTSELDYVERKTQRRHSQMVRTLNERKHGRSPRLLSSVVVRW